MPNRWNNEDRLYCARQMVIVFKLIADDTLYYNEIYVCSRRLWFSGRPFWCLSATLNVTQDMVHDSLIKLRWVIVEVDNDNSDCTTAQLQSFKTPRKLLFLKVAITLDKDNVWYHISFVSERSV